MQIRQIMTLGLVGIIIIPVIMIFKNNGGYIGLLWGNIFAGTIGAFLAYNNMLSRHSRGFLISRIFFSICLLFPFYCLYIFFRFLE